MLIKSCALIKKVRLITRVYGIACSCTFYSLNKEGNNVSRHEEIIPEK